MNYFIYTLEHIYTDESHTACKLLGFFNDLEKLEQVKSFTSELSGFRDYPKGFMIKKYQIDKLHWEHGFTSVIGEIGRDYLTEGDIIDKTYVPVKELGLESVFSVSHSYTIHRYLDDERIIGVFSLKEKAEQAVEELKIQEGFILHPDDFDISELDINELLWKSGF